METPLKRFDIIRGNETFDRGHAFVEFDGDAPYVNISRRSMKCDETRNGALFLVLQINKIKLKHLRWEDNFWTEVIAIRLKPDGQYDPNGEVIRFKMGTRDGVRDVEVVQQALIATMIQTAL